jgi:hypothetical protein
MDVDLIKTKLNIKYYQGLLYSLSQDDPNYNWINEYYENVLILSDENTITEKVSEKVSDNLDVSSSIETDNHKQIFSDDTLYKKSWTKLNAIHKILKIKEFVNNLKINSEKERVQLRDDLIELIKLKILTKKEKVSYDEINGKIISLVDLQYKNGKYYYSND